ncbi:MAG: hypothetical protein E7576_03810 [Ruminococcaceae bacterium]|nr:hypothetical protein [Oscillospiraceae bacterium]
MSFERYSRIMSDLDVCIRPKNSVTFTFDGSGRKEARRLFLTGETNIDPFWKSEPDYQMLYRRIDDSLRSDLANRDRFCLDYSGKRVPYPKIAYKKLVAPLGTPMFILNDCTDRWIFGVDAKAEGLKIFGYLRVTVEVRYRKEGVDRHSTVPDPDEVFVLDLPAGEYDWTGFQREIGIDSGRVANIGFFVEGEDYEGKVLFEAPRFVSSSGHNLAGQFLPHTEDRRGYNWIGQNLSRIEWIGLKITLNQVPVFDGEIFERCHRFSETEIPLPDHLIREGENTLTVACTSDYRDASGYVLHEWGFITEKDGAILSVPESVTVGEPFAVCVEGKQGETFAFASDTLALVGKPVLGHDGLNAVTMVCKSPVSRPSFTLNGETAGISRCVERENDGVLTGTGDMLYIPVDPVSVENYLKWYLSAHIGNLLTIRPSYRWNGTRTLNSGVYRKLAGFLDAMGIRYSHMLDGRELPGCNCNPSVEELDSGSFLGRQTHEFDGQFAYWGYRDVTNDLSQQMFYDLYIRMDRRFSDRMHLRYIPDNIHYTAEKQYIFRSPVEPDDMKSAAEAFVGRLRASRKGVLRHTGPSMLFKYFYQAGYEWLGAELMYSPTELTISALRGASRVYGGKIGAHLAVQWSTDPHDTESRFRRYRLALFICYMQGIDEINTEEGLWHMESNYYAHHRFSRACERHTAEQQDLYRFISTHTRRGRFYTPIAFVSGRYDGWRCFGRASTWGISRFGFSDMERAWDLLTCFYPKSVLNTLYVVNCPDREIGYYSGTPRGNVDIVPIEAEDFSPYRLLITIGYNRAESEDLKKLYEFVSRGGTLLIGWPQLSVTVNRADAVACHHIFQDGKERVFVKDTYLSHPVSVCEEIEYDDVLVRTDAGRPLIAEKRIGAGRLCFVNAKEYAGSEGVMAACREVIGKLAAECLEKEEVWAKGDRNVQFTVFEKENGGREVYFIATDWHKADPDGVGTLLLENCSYEIPVPWGQLVKVLTFGDAALYPVRDENEVIFFDGSTARVQGTGLAEFVLLSDGKEKVLKVDFTDSPIREINTRE